MMKHGIRMKNKEKHRKHIDHILFQDKSRGELVLFSDIQKKKKKSML